ncbi:MAG TPA: hypothetical protein VF234_10850 [Limnochordia bacterium]
MRRPQLGAFVPLSLTLLLIVLAGHVRRPPLPAAPAPRPERYAIVDAETGATLVHMPHTVHSGDEWVVADGGEFITYRVLRVEGHRAYAREVDRTPVPPLPPP